MLFLNVYYVNANKIENSDSRSVVLMYSCQQMEVLGSVQIFLTPNQRSWMNAMKNAAAKKPKKKIKRPEVMTGFR